MNEFYRALAKMLAMKQGEFSAYLPETVAESLAKRLIVDSVTDADAYKMLLAAVSKANDMTQGRGKLVIVDRRETDGDSGEG